MYIKKHIELSTIYSINTSCYNVVQDDISENDETRLD